MHWSKFAVATGFICGLALWTFAQTSVRGTSQLPIPSPEVQNLMLGTWSLQAHAVSAEGLCLAFPAARIPAAAGNQPNRQLEKMISVFSGTWSIHATFVPGKQFPNGGTSDGEEIWLAGPGANSLIEQYHSVGADGEYSGLGIFWPGAPNSFHVLWCDNVDSPGCRQLGNPAEWKDGVLNISEERASNSGIFVTQETFAFDTPNSFTQTLSSGSSGAALKPFLTIRATRKRPTQR